MEERKASPKKSKCTVPEYLINVVQPEDGKPEDFDLSQVVEEGAVPAEQISNARPVATSGSHPTGAVTSRQNECNECGSTIVLTAPRARGFYGELRPQSAR